MILCLIGPQGSGKSTHAQAIAQRYGLRHLDVGEIIRQQAQETSPRGELIDHLANKKGHLLPDGLSLGFLIDSIETEGFGNLIIDGLPRTLNQYHGLIDFLHTRHQTIDLLIYLDVSDETAINRVLQRGRIDDQPQAIAARIETYHKNTGPILEAAAASSHLFKVSAEPDSQTVFSQLVSRLDQIRPPAQVITSSSSTVIPPVTEPSPIASDPILYVLTHSESDFNKRNIFTGRLDVGLTEVGDQKARLAAAILKHTHLELAYRTSLKRTQQTLDFILRDHPEAEVIIDDRLIERDYGELSGISKIEYEQEHPDLFPVYHRSYDVAPPGGESMAQVEIRVLAALHDIIVRMQTEQKNVLIVAHSNSIRPIRRFFEGLSTEEMMKLEHLRHQIFTYPVPLALTPPAAPQT